MDAQAFIRATFLVTWGIGIGVTAFIFWAMCGRRPRVKGYLAISLRSGASHVSGLLCAAHMAAGPDVIRRSGPNHEPALDSA